MADVEPNPKSDNTSPIGFTEMNIYFVPVLISGILCALLSTITWLFRRRENINRIFSFFTLALALDSFVTFAWSQFGRIEDIQIWMRVAFMVGFLVPVGVILFFFAFTGYDKRMEARVLGIKVSHFQISTLSLILVFILLAQFTNLLMRPSETPRHIADVEFGPVGMFLFPVFGVIFIYLFAMAYKGYRRAESEPQKRFILLLAVGTSVWMLFGYGGIVLFPISSQAWQAISYIGTGLMAIFYFVAIVNYQSDKVHELNLNLERRVVDRTREVEEKNSELEDTLDRLEHMQEQVIVQEKMATLGQLVAGLTHEINTPIGAIRSMNDTKSKALGKLKTALEDLPPGTTGKDHEIGRTMGVILEADQLIDQGTERLGEIMTNLKNFSRLDEADTVLADIHEGIDSVLGLIEHEFLMDIEVVREYGDVPPFVCGARKLNQVFLNLLKNACQAIEGQGRITITTGLEEQAVRVTIRDTGKGIADEDLKAIFDPGFTARSSVVRASLGLSICRQIVQEHRGHIDVVSRPGEGSVFTVILPTN